MLQTIKRVSGTTESRTPQAASKRPSCYCRSFLRHHGATTAGVVFCRRASISKTTAMGKCWTSFAIRLTLATGTIPNPLQFGLKNTSTITAHNWPTPFRCDSPGVALWPCISKWKYNDYLWLRSDELHSDQPWLVDWKSRRGLCVWLEHGSGSPDQLDDQMVRRNPVSLSISASTNRVLATTSRSMSTPTAKVAGPLLPTKVCRASRKQRHGGSAGVRWSRVDHSNRPNAY